MTTLLREERYILRSGNQEHVLRVQELISGSEAWIERFRVQLSASNLRAAKTIYGSTGREVAEKAAAYLA